MSQKALSFILIVCLLPFQRVNASDDIIALPKPGTMVHVSPAVNPTILKGLKVNPKNPFKFEFVLSQGDKTSAEAKDESALAKADYLKKESTKLIKYFLAAITTPEKDLWVNLSPYEKDRIVPDSFGQTEMGRDLLAQDYLLKQLTASLIYPDDEIGKKFWKRVYEEAQGNTRTINMNMFNKVWIVPNKAVVYENVKNGTAYVVESSLKVLTEQDYLAAEKGDGYLFSKVEKISKKVTVPFLEIVIPELTKEVNEGSNFAQLRQVYNSLILATWYKKKIKDSILAQVYANKNKIKGTQYQDSLNVQSIYSRYLESFKKGTYNFIKEEKDSLTQQIIPRKYFSGGVELFDFAMRTTSTKPVEPSRVLVTVSAELLAERSQYYKNEGTRLARMYQAYFQRGLNRKMSYEEVESLYLIWKESKQDIAAEFWSLKENAKMYIRVLLDSNVPGFREARKKPNIALMHDLFNAHVKSYVSPEDHRFQGMANFLVDHGAGPLYNLHFPYLLPQGTLSVAALVGEVLNNKTDAAMNIDGKLKIQLPAYVVMAPTYTVSGRHFNVNKYLQEQFLSDPRFKDFVEFGIGEIGAPTLMEWYSLLNEEQSLVGVDANQQVINDINRMRQHDIVHSKGRLSVKFGWLGGQEIIFNDGTKDFIRALNLMRFVPMGIQTVVRGQIAKMLRPGGVYVEGDGFFYVVMKKVGEDLVPKIFLIDVEKIQEYGEDLMNQFELRFNRHVIGRRISKAFRQAQSYYANSSLFIDKVSQNLKSVLKVSEKNGLFIIDSDQAMGGFSKGGIDFNAEKMKLETKMDSREQLRVSVNTTLHGNDSIQRDDKGIKLNIDPALLKNLENAAGFKPIITKIAPCLSLNNFLNN